jgi:drug/metabolite transporter (DMT)-like permease
MEHLIISILISSCLFVIFKLFNVFKINTLQAITVNYFVAFLFGFFSSDLQVNLHEIPEQPWFLGALSLSVLFIVVFNLMAATAQKNGLSVASVSNKMSVIIPVIFGVIVYHEAVGYLKVIGILLALVAVYLSASKSDVEPLKRKNLILPLLLFLGSGVLDTTLKYVETTLVPNGGVPIFSATIFIFAFFLGCLLLLVQALRGKFKFEFKNIIGGIVLGIPNYYSIEFLLKALKTEGFESSTVFTINNVSVVILTTLFALLFFKEKLIKKNWAGIGIAIVSIILVVFYG